ncbi:MAG: hypothetical protein [Circular genetic element sp.]|nr:MAG: hypothetical protein [Circular genetic element sp.]
MPRRFSVMPTGSTQRKLSAMKKVAGALSRAYIRRKSARSALPKRAKTQVKTMVKREIGRQAETFMNWGRFNYQGAQPAPNTFDGAKYFLGNIGGIIDINAQTMSPMKTINALAVNANIAGGQSAYNQTYHGKSIYGKYMKTKVNLVLPSIKTISVGGADWQTMPQNYEYRFIVFKTKNQPAINNAAAGFTNAPFSVNGFKNEVGSTFGINSIDADSLPDPSGVLQPFINQDLMRAPVNKTNFTVLMEKRGRLSPGTAMNATSNPSSVTNGARQYSSEANFSFTHKINKKLNLQLESGTVQTTPDITGVQRITNYDTSICMFLVLSPLGEGVPSSLSSAKQWNDRIEPYIHISNSFTFTDM